MGIQIRLYGKVAVALAVCGQRQREASPERAVEALLLLKEDETWRIAAQGWDKERDDSPFPRRCSTEWLRGPICSELAAVASGEVTRRCA